MSVRRLTSLLQQRLKLTRSWMQGNSSRNTCQCSRASARPRAGARGGPGPRGLVPVVTLQAFGLPGIFSWGSKEREQKKEESKAPSNEDPDKAIIAEADRLYAIMEVKPLYEFLAKHKNSSNPEILWRLARATTDLGKHAIIEEIREDCYNEAFKYIERALELTQDSAAVHKWYAILLNYIGDYKDNKTKIANAVKIREHFEKALELNPSDTTTIHSIGYWCYTFADLKWYQRKLAAALYATPPSATFQEALDYFQKAEQMEPNFYSANLLMLGKTYMKLRDPVLAYTYLKKCAEYPVKTPDDKQSHIEAVKLLKSMGVKDGDKP